MVTPYCPKRGDIIWLDFEPQSGREITKRRPAIVLSHYEYNQRRGLCLVCPISSKKHGNSFEVPVLIEKRKSYIKSDQMRSFDWQSRNAKRIGKADAELLHEVIENILALIEE